MVDGGWGFEVLWERRSVRAVPKYVGIIGSDWCTCTCCRLELFEVRLRGARRDACGLVKLALFRSLGLPLWDAVTSPIDKMAT